MPRKVSRRAAAESSVTRCDGTALWSHRKKRIIASPSLTCARRAPAISESFLTAFIIDRGRRRSSDVPASRTTRATAWLAPGSTHTGESSAAVRPSSAGKLSYGRILAAPSRADLISGETLAGSMKSVASRAVTSAYAIASGL